jgi:hypothetical protein
MAQRVNWAERFSDIMDLQGVYPKGDGWFTSREFMKNMGVAQSKGYRLIKKSLNEDKLEAFTGSEWSDVQHQCYRQVWYRFKDPK